MLSVAGFNQPTRVNIHGLTPTVRKCLKVVDIYIGTTMQGAADPWTYYDTTKASVKLSDTMDDIDFNVQDFVQKLIPMSWGNGSILKVSIKFTSTKNCLEH